MGNERDRRREERIRAVLPVDTGNAEGVTCDVSASGMLFETDAAFAMGDTIEFTVDFDTPGGRMIRLKCRGNIVRTEVRNTRLGVAVKILEARMEEARSTWREGKAASI